MYEYRTTTCYGMTLPEQLVPPEPTFRLREILPIMTSENDTHCTNDRHSSWSNAAGSGNLNIPFTTSVQRSKIYQWVILWERYTEQEN